METPPASPTSCAPIAAHPPTMVQGSPSETAAWSEQVRLPVVTLQDVLVARFVGREEATKMGLTPAVLIRIATAISEIARNVVQHAGSPGEIRLGRIEAGGRPGLRIVVTDHGRGLQHPEQLLEGAAAGNLGAGLPGTRRLADRFDLQSSPGTGTTVTMEFWTPEGAP